MTRKGYLVVEKRPLDAAGSANSRYQGIDRTPPWSQDDFEAGFVDPLLAGALYDENGLLSTRDAAERALDEFAQIRPRDSLTILYVEDVTASEALSPLLGDVTFLGFDVAALDAPFWSALGDPPLNPAVRSWVNRTNDRGLLSSIHDARSYLTEYRAASPEHADVTLGIWRVSEMG